ncbi:hypothetical protein BJ322DRAFT_284800 [Thelephora terrestris]|uniref:Uncharacterized protein n=1 Tax=Thelephora terrestris TaxID=56493 RepID=A0A9P6H951_9AGAM|nr:hypothetical protein BJ322DRAFT_284800 [Thelephora terrestris]
MFPSPSKIGSSRRVPAEHPDELQSPSFVHPISLPPLRSLDIPSPTSQSHSNYGTRCVVTPTSSAHPRTHHPLDHSLTAMPLLPFASIRFPLLATMDSRRLAPSLSINPRSSTSKYWLRVFKGREILSLLRPRILVGFFLHSIKGARRSLAYVPPRGVHLHKNTRIPKITKSPNQSHRSTFEDTRVATTKDYHSAEELFHLYRTINIPGAWAPVRHLTTIPLHLADIPLILKTFHQPILCPSTLSLPIIQMKRTGMLVHLSVQTLGMSLEDPPLISRKRARPPAVSLPFPNPNTSPISFLLSLVAHRHRLKGRRTAGDDNAIPSLNPTLTAASNVVGRGAFRLILTMTSDRL